MTLAEEITTQIYELIAAHQLQPGDRLPAERRLAEELGCSRSSLREAIRGLVSQGVLRSRQGGGNYLTNQILTRPMQSEWLSVLDPLAAEDPAYRYDVLEARHALEGATAWYAALRATEADKERIWQCFQIILDYQQAGDKTNSSRADAEFHLAIAAATHNAVLVQMMHGVADLLRSTVTENRQRMYVLGHSQQRLAEDHQNITEAICRGDAEAAQAYMHKHIDYVRECVRSLDEDMARQQRASRLTHLT